MRREKNKIPAVPVLHRNEMFADDTLSFTDGSGEGPRKKNK